jgi:Domain of unknown function (DUF1704)
VVEIRVPKALWDSFESADGRAQTLLALAQRLIGACTPVNLESERARLVGLAQTGRFEAPAFAYAAQPSVLVRCEAAHELWQERARELELENAIVATRGTPAISNAVQARWPRLPADSIGDALALQWLSERFEPEALQYTSSGREPDSLISRMRFALRDTDVQVQPRPGMSALAATGMECVYVCENRKISANDVARTVVHEVEGHVRPRLRARASGLSILVLGTALGAETQEGYALLCEERAGLLIGKRRHTLALRHLATRRMQSGATFPETARWLSEHTAIENAIAITCRIFRGTATGLYPGIGREALYLPAYLCLREAGSEPPLVRCGQVGFSAAAVLKEACTPVRWSQLLELAETYR